MRQMFSMGPMGTDFGRVLQGSQGTLGIVSWASVYCERIPALAKAFFVGAGNFERIADLAYEMLHRTMGAQLFVLNNVHLAMILAKDRKTFAQLVIALPTWVLFINLASGDYFPQEKMAYQQADLRACAAGLGLTVEDALAGLSADKMAAFLDGGPTGYYKDVPQGAHKDVFFLHQLDKTPGFMAALDKTTKLSAGPVPLPGVYLQPMVQGVNCHIEFTLLYDPSDSTATQSTSQVAEKIARQMLDAGAFFSRPYGSWAAIAFEKDAAIKPFLATTKQIFDPNGILNPGKLCY
jgi:FAD/FMN-containing dehydrogenase